MTTPAASGRICPGCGGKISRRATLCAGCRRSANVIGASVVANVADAHPAPARPRTSEQNRVYHGTLARFARLRFPEMEAFAAKRQARRLVLEHASKQFRRQIESSTELSELEMEQLLEWLDDQIDAIEA